MNHSLDLRIHSQQEETLQEYIKRMHTFTFKVRYLVETYLTFKMSPWLKKQRKNRRTPMKTRIIMSKNNAKTQKKPDNRNNKSHNNNNNKPLYSIPEQDIGHQNFQVLKQFLEFFNQRN